LTGLHYWHSKRTEVEVPEKLYSSTQAAARLGVSRVTVYNWVEAGMFPHAYRLSGGEKSPLRIPESDIKAFEAKRQPQPQQA
jgi:excisionase family DNA binding protein